jgi:hypothetical protein
MFLAGRRYTCSTTPALPYSGRVRAAGPPAPMTTSGVHSWESRRMLSETGAMFCLKRQMDLEDAVGEIKRPAGTAAAHSSGAVLAAASLDVITG